MPKNDEGVLCYTGICPECKQVVAVHVADASEPDLMRHAIRERNKWLRSRLNVGTCSVGDIRTGTVPLGHADECVSGNAVRKRAAKRNRDLFSDVA